MIRRGGVILWPVYFDAKATRQNGRRVPVNLAKQRPSVDEIVAACRKLGFECEQVEASYPRMWFRKMGYVLVKTKSKISKQRLILMIAEELRKLGR